VVNVSGSQGVSGEKLVSRSLEIKELKTSLDSYGKINEHNAEQEGRSFERRMLLVADKDTPYYLIVSVVFTARQARYLKYQMVVISTKAD
jgi:biopolymer transport protein ExbD